MLKHIVIFKFKISMKIYEKVLHMFPGTLGNLIEKTFDQTVFNETHLTKAYGLGLDLSSFEGLRNQLEQDYGLTMREEERIVKVVKVVYPN